MSHIFKEWVLNNHRKANHMYNEGEMPVPYEFHLQMVAQVGRDYRGISDVLGLDPVVVEACNYAHDGPEDIPYLMSYGKILRFAKTCFEDSKATEIAECALALKDDDGRNRKERHSEKWAQRILSKHLHLFCKLCDRVANMRFSRMMRTPQLKMYREEYPEFLAQLKLNPANSVYAPMLKEMEDLLK